MTQTKKRIKWVDIVKCICIICVIRAHIEVDDSINIINFFEPFFLTGFLFCSGYTYNYSEGFIKHLAKKSKQLLVPWFTFSMIGTIVNNVFTFHPENHNFINDVKLNFMQLRGIKDGMWFVSALFIAYIVFYFYIKSYENIKNKNKKVDSIYITIGVVLYTLYNIYIRYMPSDLFPWNRNVLPWHIEYIPFALVFMFIGYLTKEKYEKQIDNIAKQKYSVYILLVVYLLIVYMPYYLNISIIFICNIIYSLIKSIFGILLIVVFSKTIKPNKLLLLIGQNTIIYFAFHNDVLTLIEYIIPKLNNDLYLYLTTDPIVSVLYSIIVIVFVSLVLIVPTKIINKYFPFLLGKWYKKEIVNK